MDMHISLHLSYCYVVVQANEFSKTSPIQLGSGKAALWKQERCECPRTSPASINRTVEGINQAPLPSPHLSLVAS